MNGLFRSATPGFSDYAALAMVLAAFVASLGLILMPQGLPRPAAPVQVQSQNGGLP